MTLQELLVKIGVDMSGTKAGLEDALSGFTDFGSKVTAIGEGIAAAFAIPLAAIGTAAFKAAEDFEAVERQIKNATGATGEALKGLSESFEKVFSEVPVSAATAGEAVALLNQQLGLTGKPLEDLSEQMIMLAKRGNDDLKGMILSVSDAFDNWNISAEEQGKQLNYLFAIYQKTGIKISEMSAELIGAGPALRELGFSFQDAATIIARFGDVGVKASEIMPGLTKAIGNLAKQGLSARESFNAIIDSLKNQTNETVRVQQAQELFGKSYLKVLDLIKSGKFDIDEWSKALSKSASTMSTSAGQITTLSGKITLLKNEMEKALAPIGTVMVDALKRLIDLMKPAVDWIAHLLAGFKNLSPGAQEAVVAIGALVVAVGGLKAAMKLLEVFDEATGLKFAGPFEKLAETVKHAGSVVAAEAVGIVGSLKNIKFAVENDMVGALSQGETAMLNFARAIPTAGLLAGIAVGVGLQLNDLRKTIGDFVEQAKAQWKDLEPTFIQVFQDVVDAVTPIWKGFSAVVGAIFPEMVAVAKVAWSGFSAVISELSDALAQLNLPSFKEAFLTLVGPIAAINGMLKDLISTMQKLSGIYPEMIKAGQNQANRVQQATLNQPQYSDPTSAAALQAQLDASRKQLAAMGGSSSGVGGFDPLAAKAAADAAKKAADEINAAFSTLGLVDYKKKLEDLTQAYFKLRDAGLLSSADQAKALEAINEAAKNLQKTFLDLQFTKLGIQPMRDMEAEVEKLRDAFGSIKTAFLDGVSGVGIDDVERALGKLEEAEKKLNSVLPDTNRMLRENAASGLVLSQQYANIATEVDRADEAFKELLRNLPASGSAHAQLIDVEGLRSGAIAILNVADAYKQLGIRSKLELDSFAHDAKLDFELISNAAGESSTQAAKAYMAMVEAMAAANDQDVTSGMVAKFVAMGAAIETTKQQMLRFGQDIGDLFHKAFDSLHDAIGRNIVEWGGWRDSIISIGKQFASGLISIFTAQLFKPLETKLAELGVKIATNLGQALGFFGEAGKVGSSVASGAAGAAGSAGAAAAGAGGAASSGVSSITTAVGGLASTLNMVTGAISAISSVVGNFQSAKMETTMNAVEHNTRYTQIILQGFSDMASKFLPKIEALYDVTVGAVLATLRQVRDAVMHSTSINLSVRSGTTSGQALLDTIVNKINTPDTNMFDVMVDLNVNILKVLSAITEGFAKLSDNIVAETNLIVGGLAAIEKKFPSLLEKILGMGGGLLGGVGTAVTSLGGSLGGLLGGLLGGGSSKDVGKIEVTTRAIQSELTNLRKDSWDREGHLLAKLDDIWSSIRDGFGSVFTRLGDVWSSVREIASIKEPIVGALNAVTAQLQAISIAASSNFDLAMSDAIAAGFAAVNEGLDTITSAVDNVANILGDVQGAIGIAASGIIEALTGIHDAVSTTATEPVSTSSGDGSADTTPSAPQTFDNTIPNDISGAAVINMNGDFTYAAGIVQAIKDLAVVMVGQFDRLIAALGTMGAATAKALEPDPKTQAALKQIADAQAILNDLIAKGGSADEVREMAAALGVTFKWMEDGSVQILNASVSMNAAADATQAAANSLQDSATGISNSLAGFSDVVTPAVAALVDTAATVIPALGGIMSMGEVVLKGIGDAATNSFAGWLSASGLAPSSDGVSTPGGVMTFDNRWGLVAPAGADNLINSYDSSQYAAFLRDADGQSRPITFSGDFHIVPAVDGREVGDAFLQHLRDHGVEVR